MDDSHPCQYGNPDLEIFLLGCLTSFSFVTAPLCPCSSPRFLADREAGKYPRIVTTSASVVAGDVWLTSNYTRFHGFQMHRIKISESTKGRKQVPRQRDPARNPLTVDALNVQKRGPRGACDFSSYEIYSRLD